MRVHCPFAAFALAFVLMACSSPPVEVSAPQPAPEPNPEAPLMKQDSSALIGGTHKAVAYSGYRQGQHPQGKQPTREQVREDMKILVDAG